MNVNEVGIQQVLEQMREIKQKMQLPAAEGVNNLPPDTAAVDFSATLKNAVDAVNDVQKAAEKLKNSFNEGDPQVNLVDVTLASQKASLAFEATVQVRNRLVNAYKEIMNMPV